MTAERRSDQDGEGVRLSCSSSGRTGAGYKAEFSFLKVPQLFPCRVGTVAPSLEQSVNGKSHILYYLYTNVSKLADSAECAHRKPCWFNVNPPALVKTKKTVGLAKTEDSGRMFLSRDSACYCLDVGGKITKVDHTPETVAPISANRKA